MRTPRFQTQKLRDAFRRKKVLTRNELLQATGCSSMTVWRLLKACGYWTSYNFNGRFYTLADIPQFDEQGLWAYQGIRFSKWGPLTETMIAMIENSEAGMTPEQLQQQLHVENVRPALSRLIERNSLTRKKFGGQFVYFSLAEISRERQQKRRAEREMQPLPPLPPAEQIIALLVEIVQRPENSPRQWARRLRRHEVHLSTREIQAVLDHYQLAVKKGLSTS
jgi:hypothetical protein